MKSRVSYGFEAGLILGVICVEHNDLGAFLACDEKMYAIAATVCRNKSKIKGHLEPRSGARNYLRAINQSAEYLGIERTGMRQVLSQ